MSYLNTTGKIEVRDRENTWRSHDGTVWSIVDLGICDIAFDSAEEARVVAARCVKAADAMEALAGGSP